MDKNKNINSHDLKYRAGRYCSALRKYLGFTCKQIAEATGVTENRVLNFERGYTNDSPLLIYYMSLEGFNKKTFIATLGLEQFCDRLTDGE